MILPAIQRDKGFDQSTFEKQMAVMRGQVSELCILVGSFSPFNNVMIFFSEDSQSYQCSREEKDPMAASQPPTYHN